MPQYNDPIRQAEYEDELREHRKERNYQAQLARNPDCRDPDHPGCIYCTPESFGAIGICPKCDEPILHSDESMTDVETDTDYHAECYEELL